MESDFCDEVALLGEMADEAFMFLQTHLKSYTQLDTGDRSVKQHVEIIDSATLLKLDLWIRMLVNFVKNMEVRDYVIDNKPDAVKYLLLFLQHIDKAVKKNPNISAINSIVIGTFTLLFIT